MIKLDIALTTGRMLAGKRVFLINMEFSITALVDLLTMSAKTNQAAIPAVSHTTNGTLLTGFTLNPTLKITQKTNIVTRGLINAHIKPSIDPT